MTDELDVINEVMEEVVTSLERLTNQIIAITAILYSHEERVLALEGKEVPDEIREHHLHAMTQAAEAGMLDGMYDDVPLA